MATALLAEGGLGSDLFVHFLGTVFGAFLAVLGGMFGQRYTEWHRAQVQFLEKVQERIELANDYIRYTGDPDWHNELRDGLKSWDDCLNELREVKRYLDLHFLRNRQRLEFNELWNRYCKVREGRHPYSIFSAIYYGKDYEQLEGTSLAGTTDLDIKQSLKSYADALTEMSRYVKDCGSLLSILDPSPST